MSPAALVTSLQIWVYLHKNASLIYFPHPWNTIVIISRIFFENTVREIKAMSHKKRVRLGDAAPDEYFVVFYKGKMVDIICPHKGAKKTPRK